MVLKDNLKHMVKIRSNKTSGELVVTATEESFGISLEGAQDPYVPSCFFIEKNSEEYLAFHNFFTNCQKNFASVVLVDEKTNIEHATVLCFSQKNNGIMLRFANEKNFPPEVWHFPQNQKTTLSSYYFELFKTLQTIKHHKQEEQVFARA